MSRREQAQHQTTPTYLTRADLAARWRRSIESIDLDLRRLRLPILKLGRRVLIDLKDVERVEAAARQVAQ